MLVWERETPNCRALCHERSTPQQWYGKCQMQKSGLGSSVTTKGGLGADGKTLYCMEVSNKNRDPFQETPKNYNPYD